VEDLVKGRVSGISGGYHALAGHVDGYGALTRSEGRGGREEGKRERGEHD
jgi:hypothetical protein